MPARSHFAIMEKPEGHTRGTDFGVGSAQFRGCVGPENFCKTPRSVLRARCAKDPIGALYRSFGLPIFAP